MPKQPVHRSNYDAGLPYHPPYTEPRQGPSSRQVWRQAAGGRPTGGKGRRGKRRSLAVLCFLCVVGVSVFALLRLPGVLARQANAETPPGEKPAGEAAPAAVQPYTGEVITLVLDAGHGGADTGAQGINGVNESDLTRDMLNRLVALLEGDERFALVITTGEGETQLSTEARGTVSGQVGADFFLSLHFNEYKNDSVSGFQVFAQPPNHPQHAGSLAAAKLLANQVKQKTSLNLMGDTGIYYMFFEDASNRTPSDHTWYIDDYTLSLPTYGVLEHASCPGLLVEMWYLTSYTDMNLMNNEQGYAAMAECLCDMLYEYFGLDRPL